MHSNCPWTSVRQCISIVLYYTWKHMTTAFWLQFVKLNDNAMVSLAVYLICIAIHAYIVLLYQ